ncbi:hypothetical protein C8R44DRAFT_820355 [Mycena epipterygia]|nr:hypothetical protein C8R44DRAFT_820355 [Mycena epipterygia]
MLSFSGSETIALCLEAIAYGMYLILFSACMSVSHHRRKEDGGINYKFFVTSVVLFVFITWHLVIDIIRLSFAYQHVTTLEADIYYSNLPSALSIIKTGVYVAITVVSDAFMLYRCYVVWNHRIPITILPLLLFMADIATGIAAVINLHQTTSSFYVAKQARITEVFFSMTLATNGVSTILIAFRVWRSQRAMSETARPSTLTNLNKITIIVLESGAIYSTILLLVLATYVGQATAAFNVFLDLTSPVIGIVFSLIIVRVSLGFKNDGTGAQEHISTLMFHKSGGAGAEKNPTQDTVELKSMTARTGLSTTSTSTRLGTNFGSEVDVMGKLRETDAPDEPIGTGIIFSDPVP